MRPGFKKRSKSSSYWSGSFKGKPLVQTVVFRPVPDASTRLADLKTGAVDLAQDIPPDQVKGVTDAGLTVVNKESPQESLIFFASNAPGTPLADKRVRQAINYGVNVDSIIATVMGGHAQRIAGPISPLTLGYDAGLKPYAYDLAKAKALLADAGFAAGFDMVIDATSTASSAPLEAVVGELTKLNIRATIRRLDLGTFNDNWQKKQSSPMVSASWAGMFDPASALNFWAKSDGLLSRYKNAEADRLIAEGASTLDQARRVQSYAQLAKVLSDDPLALYLWTSQSLTGVGKRVSGWRAHPRSYIVSSGVSLR